MRSLQSRWQERKTSNYSKTRVSFNEISGFWMNFQWDQKRRNLSSYNFDVPFHDKKTLSVCRQIQIWELLWDCWWNTDHQQIIKWMIVIYQSRKLWWNWKQTKSNYSNWQIACLRFKWTAPAQHYMKWRSDQLRPPKLSSTYHHLWFVNPRLDISNKLLLARFIK